MAAAPTIRDIMSPVPVILKPERTLEEARDFLRDAKAFAAPVVTDAGHAMGVVTQYQLLKCFLKRSQVTTNMHQLKNYLTELEGVVSIGEHESVTAAFKALLSSPGRRVYVINQSEKIVGVLEADSFFSMFSPGGGAVEGGKRKRLLADGSLAEPSLEEMLFENAASTMHALNFEGKILAANQALHELLGYNPGELIGKTVKELYAPQEQEDVMRGFHTLKENGFMMPVNTAFIRKDQTLVKIDVTTIVRYEGTIPSCTVSVGTPTESEDAKNLIRRLAALRKTGQ